jgi:hypothetical protein
MNRSLLWKGIPFIIFFLLIFSVLTFSKDIGKVKFQGIVMELDLKRHWAVVNEKPFVWNEKTVFNDEKGSPATVDKLKIKAWVYIEGEYDKALEKYVAKKIYFLPRYIPFRERYLYPFIQ